MSQADFTPTPPFRKAAPKAKMTIYFALLIIAFFAMLVACGFMYAEIRWLGGFGSVQGQVSAVDGGAQNRAQTLAQSASDGPPAESLPRAAG